MSEVIQEAAEAMAAEQAALSRGEIGADDFRATMRELRDRLGETDYMAAKFQFAAATSR